MTDGHTHGDMLIMVVTLITATMVVILITATMVVILTITLIRIMLGIVRGIGIIAIMADTLIMTLLEADAMLIMVIQVQPTTGVTHHAPLILNQEVVPIVTDNHPSLLIVTTGIRITTRLHHATT